MATLVCLSDKIMVSTDDGSCKVVLLCCMSFSGWTLTLMYTFSLSTTHTCTHTHTHTHTHLTYTDTRFSSIVEAQFLSKVSPFREVSRIHNDVVSGLLLQPHWTGQCYSSILQHVASCYNVTLWYVPIVLHHVTLWYVPIVLHHVTLWYNVTVCYFVFRSLCMFLQVECTPDAPFLPPFENFDPQNARCDFAQVLSSC